MASMEEVTEPVKNQTWVLKVSIHCEGCKKKVKKILLNINGVHSVDIDSQQNKVTVTGVVDADTLIRRLAKSGKHADMWPEKKPDNPNPNKEKESEITAEKKKKKKNQPAADEVAATDKTLASTASESDTKPAEKPKESAAAVAEQEAPKPVKKPEKEPADTNSDTGTNQADTSTKSAGSSKKKGKKQGESATAEGQSSNFPQHPSFPAHPVYQQPVYAVSHNTAHPVPSHSYYYTPQPMLPQTYSGYNYSHLPQPEYYPPAGNYNYYGSDNYYMPAMETRSPISHSYLDYGSSESDPYSYYGLGPDPRGSASRSSSQGGLDMFSEESPNGCNVM